MPDNEMSGDEDRKLSMAAIEELCSGLPGGALLFIEAQLIAAQERGRRDGLEEAAIIIDMTCKFADARACLRTVTDFAVREILIATAIAIRSRLTKKDSE